MVREDSWREVHRLFHVERRSKSEIAQGLNWTGRRCAPFCRRPRGSRTRGPSAPTPCSLRTRRICRPGRRRSSTRPASSSRSCGSSGYRGSYETVKRFVRPLRDAEQAAERATVRFETPPGQQSQIDWGQAQIHYGTGRSFCTSSS